MRCRQWSYGLIIQSLSQITNLVSADEHLGPHREGEVSCPRLAAAQVPPPAPHTGVLSAELPRLHILVSTQIYISLHTLYRSISASILYTDLDLDPVPVLSCPCSPPLTQPSSCSGHYQNILWAFLWTPLSPQSFVLLL